MNLEAFRFGRARNALVYRFAQTRGLGAAIAGALAGKAGAKCGDADGRGILTRETSGTRPNSAGGRQDLLLFGDLEFGGREAQPDTFLKKKQKKKPSRSFGLAGPILVNNRRGDSSIGTRGRNTHGSLGIDWIAGGTGPGFFFFFSALRNLRAAPHVQRGAWGGQDP